MTSVEPLAGNSYHLYKLCFFSYKRVDELGHDFFRLQCYFVTHFIYVMSDWGRHQIQRALFEEELKFIVTNLTQAHFLTL